MGSEMCIRDRADGGVHTPLARLDAFSLARAFPHTLRSGGQLTPRASPCCGRARARARAPFPVVAAQADMETVADFVHRGVQLAIELNKQVPGKKLADFKSALYSAEPAVSGAEARARVGRQGTSGRARASRPTPRTSGGHPLRSPRPRPPALAARRA